MKHFLLKTGLMRPLLLLLVMLTSVGAWGGTVNVDVLSFSRSGSTDTKTPGFTFGKAAENKSEYYQDGSGNTTKFLSLYRSTSLFEHIPTSITFTAKLGGGSTKDPLDHNVYVCFVDENGNNIDNTETQLTNKITNTNGSEFSVSMQYNSSACGVKIYHEKETGYNVRYYSFSLSYEYAETVVSVTGVTINKSETTIVVGGHETLTATVTPEDATNKNVTWSSNNTAVATIDATTGEITAVAAGTATITATTEDGNKTATCAVTVETIPVTNVTLVPTSVELILESTQQLTATIEPNNATNKNITWSTSNGSVATVSETGLVTAVGVGNATITATAQDGSNVSGSCAVTVTLPATVIITWSVNGNTSTDEYTEGQSITFNDPAPATIPDGYVFEGWSETTVLATDTKPTMVTSAIAPHNDKTYYAVFAKETETVTNVDDVLDYNKVGVTGTTYSDWSNITDNTAAVYKGQSAGGNESIQLRSSNNNSGIVTTTSGGKLKKITVDWNTNTANDRVLNVYGKNSAYTEATNLYSNTTWGTTLGTIVNGTTELTINGDYTYVGVRSNSGAMYLNSITFTWETNAIVYSGYTTSVEGEEVNITDFTAENTTIAQNGTANTTVTNDQPGWTASYTYSTSDETVATVNNNGVITGVARGTATITATLNIAPSEHSYHAGETSSKSLDITVTEPVVITANPVTMTYGGADMAIVISQPEDYVGTHGFTSANASVATVNSTTGVVQAVAAGTTTITITSSADAAHHFTEGENVTVNVTVNAPEGVGAVALVEGETIFNETFENSTGTSGWSGGAGAGTLICDNDGWVLSGEHGNGGSAKLGSSSKLGSATTPALGQSGDFTLTFKSGAWSGDKTTGGLLLSVEGGGTISPTSFDLTDSQWTSYEATITDATAQTKITFAAAQDSHNRFFLDEVKVRELIQPEGTTVTLNSAGYATYCDQNPIDFSATEGYTAWAVASVNASTGEIGFTKITEGIKGGQGVLLKGEVGATVTIKYMTETCNTLLGDGNKLVGTLAPTFCEAETVYGLSGNQFYLNNAGTVKANKAYLPAGVLGSSVKSFTFVFEDTTTGITTVEKVNDPQIIYDLFGRRVSKTQKGLQIINGKKVFIR